MYLLMAVAGVAVTARAPPCSTRVKSEQTPGDATEADLRTDGTELQTPQGNQTVFAPRYARVRRQLPGVPIIVPTRLPPLTTHKEDSVKAIVILIACVPIAVSVFILLKTYGKIISCFKNCFRKRTVHRQAAVAYRFATEVDDRLLF